MCIRDRKSVVISGAVVVICVAGLVVRAASGGPLFNYSLDFAGGNSTSVDLSKTCLLYTSIKKATKSQKIALILETYCDMNMKYNKDSKGRPVHGEGDVYKRQM